MQVFGVGQLTQYIRELFELDMALQSSFNDFVEGWASRIVSRLREIIEEGYE